MLPERWAQVEKLYFSALEQDPENRSRFLIAGAGDDGELLKEVLSLLNQPGTDSRLDRPVWDSAVEGNSDRLPAGTLLGSYEIQAPLGAGGMGKVFRALDTRLNRTVAIKFPKRHFTESFKREARAAAALNHPNIVQIYELGSADGDEYIVMEFVPGCTLADLIRKRRLSIKEALVYSAGIASALAAAHAAGIVHRDIKPGNIIVNGDLTLVKILDFGLALLEEPSSSRNGTPPTFRDCDPDAIQGTPSYMSPEQVQGTSVDVRSDIFSTGLVLYEIFTGVRAIGGDSTRSVMGRVVRLAAVDIRKLRPDVPRSLSKIIARCLEQDPSRRYSSGAELATAIGECSRPRRFVPLTPRITAAITIVLIAIAGAVGWLHYQNRNARWIRDEALPKIQSLVARGDYVQAFALTRTALRHAPDDPQLKQHWANLSWPLTMTTVPPNAQISLRPFGPADLRWERVGKTPVQGVRVPLANLRIRIERDGTEPLEFATFTAFLQGQKLKLHRTGTIPVGMVSVPKEAPPAGPVKIMALPDYFLDKFEVTNVQFQEFINSGGYRKQEYWRYPFFRDGRKIPWQQAVAGFRDRSGQNGPATWDLGIFPNGQADYPVAGVSWFEAAAYCQSVGKSLPTVYHWQKAAGFSVYSDIVLFSNFSHGSPMLVGANTGITPFGAYDMAGNVKEWVQNDSGGRRLILGGSFSDPGVTFHDLDAQNPFLRLPNFGLRCASYPAPIPAVALAPVNSVERDYSAEKPVSDTIFEFIKRIYAYEKTPVLAETENVDDSNTVWRREKVSYAAGYNGERIPAYLFLPKNVKPPYQTVLFVPNGFAQHLPSSVTGATTNGFDFLMRTGRAVLYPVYKSTFERRVENLQRPDVYRESMIQLAKDASRSVDYLETRSDIQAAGLGYYGMSLGGDLGPIILALDQRIKAGVLVSAGLSNERVVPEIDSLNFAPRVRSPVLMLAGRYDFVTPLATLQKPLFRLLGTSEPDKRFVEFDSGHVPPLNDWMRETLSWFDHYLGPVASDRSR